MLVAMLSRMNTIQPRSSHFDMLGFGSLIPQFYPPPAGGYTAGMSANSCGVGPGPIGGFLIAIGGFAAESRTPISA